ncbi:MAG TPA: hypothetical protein VLB84_05390 [Bacteroidia bacterium]|nr:hypothetical protein [Bacteroidia bacterium]
MLCGIFLGLAIGCRITSGVMLIPFMIMSWQQDYKLMAARFFKMSISMGVVASLLFLPVYFQFGSSFFMYYDQFPYPPFTKVMYKMIPGVFGLIGTVSIFIFIIIAIIKRKNQHNKEVFNYDLDKRVRIASIVIIILYCISYFRLPQKSGYMIPTIPFVILLFGYYLNKQNFKLVCWSFCLSPFLFSINLTDSFRGAAYSKFALVFNVSGQELFLDPFSGPVFSDYSKRKQKMAFTDLVIQKSSLINSKTVIISGWWYNEIMVTNIPNNKNEFVVFEPYIDEQQLEKYKEENYRLFYLPEQNKYNDLMYKMNVTDQFATSFIE